MAKDAAARTIIDGGGADAPACAPPTEARPEAVGASRKPLRRAGREKARARPRKAREGPSAKPREGIQEESATLEPAGAGQTGNRGAGEGEKRGIGEPELVDVGRELAAYLSAGQAGLGNRAARQAGDQAADGPGEALAEPESRGAGETGSRGNGQPERRGTGGPDLVAVADWLQVQLLRSAAAVFARLKGARGGRERLEWVLRGEGGGRYLFAGVPGGLSCLWPSQATREVPTGGEVKGDAQASTMRYRRSDLRLPCVPASLAVVKETLGQEMEAAGLARDRAALFEAAVEEAGRNAGEHSPPGSMFGMTCERAEGDLVVAISSPGPFDPARVLDQRAAAGAGERGRGLAIVRSLEGVLMVATGAGVVTAFHCCQVPAPPLADPSVRSIGPSGVREQPNDRTTEPPDALPALADVRRIGESAVLLVVQADTLDGQVAPLLSACLTPLVGDQGLRHLIVDLGRVRLLASSCLGMLVKARSSVTALGRRLTLVGVGEDVRRVLEAAGLWSYFDVKATLADVVSTRLTLVEELHEASGKPGGDARPGLTGRLAGVASRLWPWANER